MDQNTKRTKCKNMTNTTKYKRTIHKQDKIQKNKIQVGQNTTSQNTNMTKNKVIKYN